MVSISKSNRTMSRAKVMHERQKKKKKKKEKNEKLHFP